MGEQAVVAVRKTRLDIGGVGQLPRHLDVEQGGRLHPASRVVACRIVGQARPDIPADLVQEAGVVAVAEVVGELVRVASLVADGFRVAVRDAPAHGRAAVPADRVSIDETEKKRAIVGSEAVAHDELPARLEQGQQDVGLGPRAAVENAVAVVVLVEGKRGEEPLPVEQGVAVVHRQDAANERVSRAGLDRGQGRQAVAGEVDPREE